jgi:hypothetical protein
VISPKQHGVANQVFNLNPVMLPEDTPQDVMCAWIRLYRQGRQDIELIAKWMLEN